MKKSSLDAYLAIVMHKIKEVSHTGRCQASIPKNNTHNDILVTELEQAGYKTDLSVDGTHLYIGWDEA